MEKPYERYEEVFQMVATYISDCACSVELKNMWMPQPFPNVNLFLQDLEYGQQFDLLNEE